MKSLLLAVSTLVSGQEPCEKLIARWAGVYADMHDGDQKVLSVNEQTQTLVIGPQDKSESWTVHAHIDSKFCNASVDFNVPGKANPPPVKLTAQFYHLNAASGRQPGGLWKAVAEFTDPSGTLNVPGYPLNHWVAVGKTQDEELIGCPSKLEAVYADMHDGDEKKVSIAGDKMTITSNNKTQDWVVHAVLDRDLCRAVIDFNVPGKANPPPVNLTATLWHANVLNQYDAPDSEKTVLEFTDPSGTLADASFPLNQWVELTDGFDPYVPPVATGKCCYGFPGSDNWKGCQSATACPSNPSCETPSLCEGICRGTWCNTASEFSI